MAAMINSSVLACNYAISGTAMSELNAKMPSSVVAAAGQKVVPAIRAQQARVSADSQKIEGRRAALLFLAATAFTSASSAASNSFANAGVIDEYLEKSKANKKLSFITDEGSSICPGKNKWPELVGQSGEAAAATIERENKKVQAIVLLDGTPTTKDFRCDRVWVWVDKNGVVIRAPQIT